MKEIVKQIELFKIVNPACLVLLRKHNNYKDQLLLFDTLYVRSHNSKGIVGFSVRQIKGGDIQMYIYIFYLIKYFTIILKKEKIINLMSRDATLICKVHLYK